MEDMISKGTGNSRWLKSVANIMTLYPTYESFAEALAAGTFPIDLNGINPAGVQTSGTRLNKANLLTDALCTSLGLSTTATPTQAMDKLRQLVSTAQNTANRKGDVQIGTYSGTSATTFSLTFSISPTIFISCGVSKSGGYTSYFGFAMKNGFVGATSPSTSASPFYPLKLRISGNTWTFDGSERNWNGLNDGYSNFTYIAIG